MTTMMKMASMGRKGTVAEVSGALGKGEPGITLARTWQRDLCDGGLENGKKCGASPLGDSL
jgi:hypothetical protein